MSEVVFRKEVTITNEQLEDIVKVLNRDGCSQQPPLTVSEVIEKPELLDYICGEIIEDGVLAALCDPMEFYRNDGWCDWKQYR